MFYQIATSKSHSSKHKNKNSLYPLKPRKSKLKNIKKSSIWIPSKLSILVQIRKIKSRFLRLNTKSKETVKIEWGLFQSISSRWSHNIRIQRKECFNKHLEESLHRSHINSTLVQCKTSKILQTIIRIEISNLVNWSKGTASIEINGHLDSIFKEEPVKVQNHTTSKSINLRKNLQ